MEPVSEDELKACLSKLVDVGVIAQGSGGEYYAAFDDLGGKPIGLALRNLTRKYGMLVGKEAVILATVPPALTWNGPQSPAALVGEVNAAISMTEAAHPSELDKAAKK